MNRILLHAFWVSLLLINPITLHAQATEFYVVVGAFAQENNAKKFTGYVKRKFYQSNYELNQQRNLYYVYAWKGTDRTEAINLAKTLQKQPEFFDCWVFAKQLPNTTPVVEEAPLVVIEEQPKEIPQETPKETVVETPPVVEPTTPDTTVVDSHEEVAVDTVDPGPPIEKKPRVVKGKLFKFDVKTPDGTPITTKVHHVNPKQGKDIASYSSDDYADMPTPAETNMTIVCGIFGYREITRVVNYTNPTAKQKDVTKDDEGAWVVPFELQRLKSGDYSIMYDVSFFKNSVAMQEKSKTDLDALLAMMQNNPRLKVRVHGHANGNQERVITNLKEEKNYFTPETASKTKATANELSRLRAQAVKNYLIDNGIEESRLDVKGVGGKGMIVSETHPASHLNDRIEIQILKD
jgi:outer membrane protein OmpA-like peptidoglycan-associated protein